MKNIEDKLKQCLIKILKKRVDAKQIMLDSNLFDIGLDSVNFIQFVVEIEREFSIEIEDENLHIDAFENIGTLKLYIEARLNRNAIKSRKSKKY